nr:MAG TPA: hypothetical protein [Caudoviricetes sp.]
MHSYARRIHTHKELFLVEILNNSEFSSFFSFIFKDLQR